MRGDGLLPLAVLLLAACLSLARCVHAPAPSPQPAPPVLAPADPAPSCGGAVDVRLSDDCGSTTSFSPYYECARCRGGSGCVANDLALYCVQGDCSDPACAADGRAGRGR